jgi:Ion channel
MRMMPEMEQHEFWQKIESFLRNYEHTYAPVRWFGDWWGLTSSREGYFVFFRFIFLMGLYLTAFYLPSYLWLKILLTTVAGNLIAEMVLLPTSIAFGGVQAMRPLRILVLIFFNYISISIAFGLLYITLCRSSFNIDPDLIDLAYFSFTTITALGIGDITPARHTLLVRFLVVSELLIGLYFWAALVGIIISWTAREVKSETNLSK